jgi:hypothetical protein
MEFTAPTYCCCAAALCACALRPDCRLSHPRSPSQSVHGYECIFLLVSSFLLCECFSAVARESEVSAHRASCCLRSFAFAECSSFLVPRVLFSPLSLFLVQRQSMILQSLHLLVSMSHHPRRRHLAMCLALTSPLPSAVGAFARCLCQHLWVSRALTAAGLPSSISAFAFAVHSLDSTPTHHPLPCHTLLRASAHDPRLTTGDQHL